MSHPHCGVDSSTALGKGGIVENTVKRNHVRAVARAIPVFRALAGVALVVLVCVVLAGCDRATKHEPVSYDVVFADDGISRSLFIADPESNVVVDSIPNVGHVIQSAVSPDGLWLYLFVGTDGHHQGGIYKIDLRARSQAAYLPIGGGLALIDSGKTLVMGGNFDSLYFIDTESFRVRETRPRSIWGPSGRLDASILVGPAVPPGLNQTLAVYDYSADTYETVPISGGYGIYETFVHPDKRRVFVVGTAGQLFVVDIITQEVVALWRLHSPFARVVFSPTGDTAYISNPEDPDDPDLIGCAEGELLCASVTGGQHSLLRTIPTGAPVMGMALSPDGSRLYCTRALTVCGAGGGGGDVISVDTRQLTISPDTIHPPGPGQPRDVLVAWQAERR